MKAATQLDVAFWALIVMATVYETSGDLTAEYICMAVAGVVFILDWFLERQEKKKET